MLNFPISVGRVPDKSQKLQEKDFNVESLPSSVGMLPENLVLSIHASINEGIPTRKDNRGEMGLN
jgi:hypothetical protein